MELNWLRYFHEVAQVKSVTLASQRLRVSQPAVTKMIKQLEESLGYALFRRNGRGIVMTAEGQKLYEISISVFNRLKDVEQIQGGLDFESREVLRVGASDSVCNYLLPSAVARFSKKFQNLQWSFYSATSSEIKQKLLSAEIDYGIFYTRLGLQEKQLLKELPLKKVPFQLAYSKKLGSWTTMAKLNQANLTYVGARSNDYPTTIPEQWLYNRVGLKIGRVVEANNKETQKQMVLAGLGFGIFPAFMIEKEVRDKSLTALALKSEHMEISLVMRKEESISLIFKSFLDDFLLKESAVK
jgi:DNA-binding transcriptional LysR family regulator